MSRGKKIEKTLSLEEKLAQTLVPVEEQPYPLPENWCWVYLTTGFAECMDSYRKPINANERAVRSGDTPYYGATGQVGWIDDFLTNEQLILVGEDGAPFLDLFRDKAYIIEGKAWVNNHAHILRSYYGRVGNYYLKNYLNIFNYSKYVNGTTRLKLTQASLDIIPVPLPPLAEQQRIIDRIESLFAKLNDTKEKAQDVLKGFEARKAAILHNAFTGSLIGKDNIRFIPLESIVDEIRIGPFGSALHEEDYILDGIPVINPKHIVNQMIIPQNKVTISLEKNLQLKSYRLKANDIILGRRGEMGRSAPVTDKEDGWLCGTGSMIIRLKNQYQAKFYSLIISSQASVQYLENHAVGTTLKNLNEKIVRQLPIPSFTIEEQDFLFNTVDSLLSKEQQAKEIAEAVLEQIEIIKKTILVQAFRGKLGTNDWKEESAVELLKTVL